MMFGLLFERCRRLCEDRCAAAKARVVRIAATVISRAAAFVAASLLMTAGVIFLCAALAVLLIELTGSLAAGLAITGVVAMVAGMIVWGCRRVFLHRAAVRGVLNAVENRKI